jgi:hypothetical protein
MTILSQIWRRITAIYGERSRTTRRSHALECEIARQGGELARQRAEVTRQRAENDHLRAAIATQQNEIARHVAEIARLRAENRALLNSILGIAGIPPILPERLPDPPSFFFAGDPAISDAPLPSSVLFPAKCLSESAAADDESRSTPSLPSITAAEKNSPGPQSPRNDIPPKPSPESSSLRSPSHSSPHSSRTAPSSPASPSSVEGQGFSPDINDRAKRDTLLPQAVAEGERPQRQGVSSRQPAPRRQLPTPLRRRSWHQIMRTLEFESGKKPAAS